MEKKTITVELDSPVMYQAGKGEVEGSHVELAEPTGKQSHLCCELESMIQASILKAQALIPASATESAKDAAPQDEDEGIDGESLLAMINAGGADMGKMVLIFKDLFRHVGTIGGEADLKPAIIDRMSHKDVRKMVGEYAANFIYGL